MKQLKDLMEKFELLTDALLTDLTELAKLSKQPKTRELKIIVLDLDNNRIADFEATTNLTLEEIPQALEEGVKKLNENGQTSKHRKTSTNANCNTCPGELNIPLGGNFKTGKLDEKSLFNSSNGRGFKKAGGASR